MPFIRVTRYTDNSVIDANINRIITFTQKRGDKFTTIHMEGGIDLQVTDAPRNLRGYIQKAEGTLPEKGELNAGQ